MISSGAEDGPVVLAFLLERASTSDDLCLDEASPSLSLLLEEDILAVASKYRVKVRMKVALLCSNGDVILLIIANNLKLIFGWCRDPVRPSCDPDVTRNQKFNLK